MSEGAFNRKRKSPSKQVIAVLIKILFILLVFNLASNYPNESISCLSKQEKPKGAHVRGRRGTNNRMYFFVCKLMGLIPAGFKSGSL